MYELINKHPVYGDKLRLKKNDFKLIPEEHKSLFKLVDKSNTIRVRESKYYEEIAEIYNPPVAIYDSIDRRGLVYGINKSSDAIIKSMDIIEDVESNENF